MLKFKDTCAQGDIYIERIKSGKLPKDVTRVEPKGKKLIVTHSETGHHHVMDAIKTDQYMTKDQLITLLKVNKTDELVHLRDHDTHETIQFKPGVYRVRRQRENVVGTAPAERRTRAVED